METFIRGVKYIRTIYMTKNSEIIRLPEYYRMIFILADIFKSSRKALRIIVLKIE
ncbi:MAG: hypothetical protein ACQEP4_02645 [Bacillota bacterium]